MEFLFTYTCNAYSILRLLEYNSSTKNNENNRFKTRHICNKFVQKRSAIVDFFWSFIQFNAHPDMLPIVERKGKCTPLNTSTISYCITK